MTIKELIEKLSQYPEDTLVLQIPPHRMGYVKVHSIALVNKVKTTNNGANYDEDKDNELMTGENAVVVY